MFKARIRVIVGIMIFLGYFLIYVVRYNIAVHIIDMTYVTQKKLKTNDTHTARMSITELINWNDMMVAKLFCAYHIGYCVCFPIFHSIGDKFGPTWVVGTAGIISGLLNCLTPAAAYYQFWTIFVVRVIKGFCAGAMQPSMVQLLRHWVPPTERNYFMWAYCGITTGTFSTFLVCAAVHLYSRWPNGFYITGACQILWSCVWVLLVTDHPNKHPFISAEELEYLDNAIGNIFNIKVTNAQAPWILILKSRPFWALCIFHFGYAWMIISMCLYGTLYYAKILQYTIYNAAALTALPFLFRLIFGTIILQTYHWYKYYKKNQFKYLKKYLIVVSHVIPGIIVISCWVFPIIPGPAILTIAVMMTAAGMDLTIDLCYELSPTFGNSIHTVIKIIGNTPGIIVPFCVAEVTAKYNNYTETWKCIWCFHATVLFMSGIVFLIFGEHQIQSWNSIKTRPKRKIHARRRITAMSNITEVEENDSSYRMSTQPKKKSFLSNPSFKFSQSKV